MSYDTEYASCLRLHHFCLCVRWCQPRTTPVRRKPVLGKTTAARLTAIASLGTYGPMLIASDHEHMLKYQSHLQECQLTRFDLGSARFQRRLAQRILARL